MKPETIVGQKFYEVSSSQSTLRMLTRLNFDEITDTKKLVELANQLIRLEGKK
jgi:hypothetical protein